MAGNRWNHDIERVLRTPAVSRRVGQRANGVEEFELRTRPAMGQDQRHGIGVARTDMDKLDVDTVNGGHELRQGIELRLGLAPVIAIAPILHQLLDLSQLHTLGYVVDRFLVGPTRVRDAFAQVNQLRFIDMNPVRTNGLRLSGCTVGSRTGRPCDTARRQRRDTEHACPDMMAPSKSGQNHSHDESPFR
ncbi:hypothetical protein D3C84_531870 [compost metagenome]